MLILTLTTNVNFYQNDNNFEYKIEEISIPNATATAKAGGCIEIMGWDFCLRWCGSGCCYTNALTTSCVGV